MKSCSPLEISQPSTPKNRNEKSSISPISRDRLSPHVYKPNTKKYSRSTRTLRYYSVMSPKPVGHGDLLLTRDQGSNTPRSPVVCVMSPKPIAHGDLLKIREQASNSPRSPSAIVELESEQVEEITRGIAGLYTKTRARQRRSYVSSTISRGGSGWIGSFVRKPGRFKVRTVILEGTTKDESK